MTDTILDCLASHSSEGHCKPLLPEYSEIFLVSLSPVPNIFAPVSGATGAKYQVRGGDNGRMGKGDEMVAFFLIVFLSQSWAKNGVISDSQTRWLVEYAH